MKDHRKERAEARKKAEKLVSQMTQNQMEWMQRMNNIKTNAEEVVLKENIYL